MRTKSPTCGAVSAFRAPIQEKAVPYALHPRNSLIDTDGTTALGESLGLTCATFVMRLFASARVPLLAESTWDSGRSAERQARDAIAQQIIVQYLGQSNRPAASGHAALVAKDVGCTRIRAEEVAAASGMKERPVNYPAAEAAGSELLAEVSALKAQNAHTETPPRGPQTALPAQSVDHSALVAALKSEDC